ncbi:serine hydrolase domain-containing protein [Rhodanobacter glycinis]|uniref:CubicO group peptidase, beta-lactamase class C family n=1 Tax=Rhodanobacter glycinis TaxID=582702 RepID=A0A1I3Z7E6_9GAMM|nr:serine hydrolase domain-containing protein [Rhodanobacter glycinis]SFK40054.1 CubicO group peptidase, beta-lactamase class C family [Rhodanobacter glycinis]
MNRALRGLVALVASVGLSVAMAQSTALPPSPAVNASTNGPAADAPALTQQDLGSFFDGLMPYALRRDDIAGGVVVVVKDGKVLFTRGYGYANLATRTPVSSDDTLFRPGSTSKLFTWTAVMQLVEQGKLSLDRDINDYLDFHIPAWHGKPITLRELMTHTAGFEDVTRGLMPASPKDLDLQRYLKDRLPTRIFPPGKIVAYSNYGCGLAGYIVQRASGEPFAQYIEQHILQPLGMSHSTFAQPLPPALAPLMSKGYLRASDGKPQPFELIDPPPAGAMSTTATDMAKFMIAQLQDGRYGDAQILQPATVRLMHSQQYAPAPGMPGFDLGFYQENRNGLRIIGHAGDTMLFHSDLHLLLDKDVGLFLSFNSAGNPTAGGTLTLRRAIFHAFLDRYFPTPLPVQAPAPLSASADATKVAGWYQTSRRNDSAMRLFNLLSQFHVAASSDGTLTVSPMLSNDAGEPLRWREVAPLKYREMNGRDRLSFVADADGHIRYWTTTYIAPVMVFQRVSAARSKGTATPLAGLSLLILLTTLATWGLGCWQRHHYRATLELLPALRRSRLYSRLGALALFVDLTGWLVLAATIGTHPTLLLQGTAAPWMTALYVFGVVALLGALAVVLHAINSWRLGSRSLHVRLGETLLALAALYLGWFILVFGLVSFNTHF